MTTSINFGSNYREMKKAHPDWTHSHLQAASLSMAEAAGNTKVKSWKKDSGSDSGYLIPDEKSLDWDDAYLLFRAQESQEAAAYNPIGGLSGGSACANCHWFISPNSCIVVNGDISPTGKSNRWKAIEVYEPEPMEVRIVKEEGTGSGGKDWSLKSVVKEVVEGLGLLPSSGLPPTPSDRSSLFSKSRELPDGSRFLATKDADSGRPRLTFWVSNNFRDSDHPPEILSAAAHQSFISWAEKNSYHPEAWLWHTPGTRWGQVDWMDYFDGFLVESVLADKGMEQVAERLAADPDLRVSHGYVIPVGGRDKDDFSVIQSYYQYEISPLLAGKEANPFTGSIPLDLTPLLTGVNTSDQQPTQLLSASLLGDTTMPMDPTKRKWLEDKLGPERVKALEAATLDLGSVAKGLGLETKDLTAALVGEPPSPEPETPTPDPVPAPSADPITADALSAAVKAAVGSQFSDLQTFLASMQADINLLKAGHNKAVADQIRPPAGDSVQYLWGKRPTDDPNNVITKAASEALGGPQDNSDQLPPHMAAMDQLVYGGQRANGHSGPGDALSH